MQRYHRGAKADQRKCVELGTRRPMQIAMALQLPVADSHHLVKAARRPRLLESAATTEKIVR
eukprot:2195478-Pleurochrysis_carterae.AAC.3